MRRVYDTVFQMESSVRRYFNTAFTHARIHLYTNYCSPLNNSCAFNFRHLSSGEQSLTVKIFQSKVSAQNVLGRAKNMLIHVGSHDPNFCLKNCQTTNVNTLQSHKTELHVHVYVDGGGMTIFNLL